jgi:hypothetical protein
MKITLAHKALRVEEPGETSVTFGIPLTGKTLCIKSPIGSLTVGYQRSLKSFAVCLRIRDREVWTFQLLEGETRSYTL